MKADIDMSFWEWSEYVRKKFVKQYPEYKGERLEICEDGSVYVHGNCAYPLIIKGFTSYNEYMGL